MKRGCPYPSTPAQVLMALPLYPTPSTLTPETPLSKPLDPRAGADGMAGIVSPDMYVLMYVCMHVCMYAGNDGMAGIVSPDTDNVERVCTPTMCACVACRCVALTTSKKNISECHDISMCACIACRRLTLMTSKGCDVGGAQDPAVSGHRQGMNEDSAG